MFKKIVLASIISIFGTSANAVEIDIRTLKKRDSLSIKQAWDAWRTLNKQGRVPLQIACVPFNGELRVLFINPVKRPGYIWLWTYGERIRDAKAHYRKMGFRVSYHHDLKGGPKGKPKKIIHQCAIMTKRGSIKEWQE